VGLSYDCIQSTQSINPICERDPPVHWHVELQGHGAAGCSGQAGVWRPRPSSSAAQAREWPLTAILLTPLALHCWTWGNALTCSPPSQAGSSPVLLSPASASALSRSSPLQREMSERHSANSLQLLSSMLCVSWRQLHTCPLPLQLWRPGKPHGTGPQAAGCGRCPQRSAPALGPASDMIESTCTL
jgi:hypothetical protein